MKKTFILLFLGILLSTAKNYACDICGCGVNNFYIGILPEFNHKFFGVRYHFNSFNTHLTGDATQYSKDFYQTIEFWGGWNVSKRIQVLAFIPVNLNRQNSDEGISKLKGLGDAVLLANYKLLDISSVNSNNKVFSQQFWIGGGIKLPTGKFQIEDNDTELASVANRQLGSGSADILLNAMYNVRIGKFGINSTVNYKLNSANKDQFRFGDKISAGSFVFYPIISSKTVVSPNVGLLYEHTKQSELKNTKIDLTGGSILQGSLGAEISCNKITVGFNAQLPIAQNFAESQTKAKIKGMAHISFAL
jgi:hypothetical protein